MGWEDEEWRGALRGRQGPVADCGRAGHHMVGRGVAHCTVCGLTVTPDEVA